MSDAKDKLLSTDKEIQHLKPRATNYKKRIENEKWLYVLVKTNGKKYWRLGYRFNGKEKLLALGVYPTTTLADARKKCAIARAQLANGIDPISNKRAVAVARKDAEENSFEVVANEWLATRNKKSSGGEKRLKNLLKRDLFPHLGRRPIKEITPRDVLKVLEIIQKRSVDMAHRAKQYAGQIFRFAIASGRAERDPTADLKGALNERKTEHFAAITDPKQVGILMADIKSYQKTPVVNAALELSALLFCRQIELCKMQWSEVNWEEHQIELPAERMKMRQPHIIPLSKQALNVLKELYALTGGNKYVFASFRGASRHMSGDTVRCALRNLGYEKSVMSAHGFRAMARTLLDERLGYPIEWIEQQLAHEVKDVNGRAYNRTKHLVQRREMVQKYADYLDALQKDPSNFSAIGMRFRHA